MKLQPERYALVFFWALLHVPVCAAQTPVTAAAPANGLSSEVKNKVAENLVSQALAHEHGEGAPKDPERAARLYCDAARYGNVEAYYSLAWMYANGRGVPRHEGYAATLFAVAAEQGHEGARKALQYVAQPSGERPACLEGPSYSAESLQQSARTSAQLAPIEAIDRSEDVQSYIESLHPNKRRIAELVSLLAPQYNIEPKLALAIASTESNFNIMARSPKGALGVMQLIPDTAARFGVRDAFDPGQNIRGGLSYLRWLLSYYRGDVLLTAAAYNAGEGAVDRNRGIPPYLETVAYVKRVLGFFKQPNHPFDEGLASPSPIVVKRIAER